MKKKKRKKRVEYITIKVHPRTYEATLKDKSLIKKFRKLAKEMAKEIKHHFKYEKDAWPLDKSHYEDEIIYKIFGCHLSGYASTLILKELGKKYMIQYGHTNKWGETYNVFNRIKE